MSTEEKIVSALTAFTILVVLLFGAFVVHDKEMDRCRAVADEMEIRVMSIERIGRGCLYATPEGFIFWVELDRHDGTFFVEIEEGR